MKVQEGSNYRRGLIATASIFTLLVVFAACKETGSVPAYVYVDKFELSTGPGQGTDSEKITEAWFFVEGNFLGAYTLPAAVPVVAEGQTRVRVSPGIKVNGISSTPDIYDFYERYEVMMDLAPGRVDTLRPLTSYTDFTNFAFLEDFETSNSFIDVIDEDPETVLEPISGPDVFEGQRSGYIRLDSDHPFIEVASIPVLDDIPTNGSDVFLEFNYKTNVQLGVGLVGTANGIPPSGAVILILRPREEWNKMYLELSPSLVASQLQGYQILLSAVHDPSLEVSEVYVDNFKLVYKDQ